MIQLEDEAVAFIFYFFPLASRDLALGPAMFLKYRYCPRFRISLRVLYMFRIFVSSTFQ